MITLETLALLCDASYLLEATHLFTSLATLIGPLLAPGWVLPPSVTASGNGILAILAIRLGWGLVPLAGNGLILTGRALGWGHSSVNAAVARQKASIRLAISVALKWAADRMLK